MLRPRECFVMQFLCPRNRNMHCLVWVRVQGRVVHENKFRNFYGCLFELPHHSSLVPTNQIAILTKLIPVVALIYQSFDRNIYRTPRYDTTQIDWDSVLRASQQLHRPGSDSESRQQLACDGLSPRAWPRQTGSGPR